MNNLEVNNNTFESIKHTDEYGNEYWKARELQQILDYNAWRYFFSSYREGINRLFSK